MTDETTKQVRVENGAHFWVVDSGENDGDTRTVFLSPPRADIKNGFPWTQYVVPMQIGSDGIYIRYDKAIEVDGNPAYQINASEEAEMDERCEVVDCNVAALQRLGAGDEREGGLFLKDNELHIVKSALNNYEDGMQLYAESEQFKPGRKENLQELARMAAGIQKKVAAEIERRKVAKEDVIGGAD